MMNFVSKSKNCVVYTRNCVLNTGNLFIKNDELCRDAKAEGLACDEPKPADMHAHAQYGAFLA